ncbi:hypothetical protein [Sediminibacter sp. Hel_I_10]|uniref:hypothetical protein n=1 Tax=Sediminibacter sp. Hel_I_10 TaxID=1392490 RepID=UPI00047EEA00|nr:hypothetical protein [Sediminibacter sp. Hel_I_10]
MKSELLKEAAFYAELLRLIDKDLKSKKLKPGSLLRDDVNYIISRTQYYNMQKVAEGRQDVSRLSNSRLKSLCDYLNVEIKDIQYWITVKENDH